jgi:uncharacterized protein (TIGR03435 family)
MSGRARGTALGGLPELSGNKVCVRSPLCRELEESSRNKIQRFVYVEANRLRVTHAFHRKERIMIWNLAIFTTLDPGRLRRSMLERKRRLWRIARFCVTFLAVSAACLVVLPSSVALTAVAQVGTEVPAPALGGEKVRERFEVVSVKPTSSTASSVARGRGGTTPTPCFGGRLQIDPGRLILTNTSVYTLIAWAYGKNCTGLSASDTLVGGPAWIGKDGFDIQANIPQGVAVESSKQLLDGTAPKLQMMFQALLADRFKLELHRDSKEVPIYVLTAGKELAKLTARRATAESQPAGAVNASPKVSLTSCPATQEDSFCRLVNRNVSMADLVTSLARITHRTVLDRTGITGEFTFNIDYAPFDGAPAGSSAPSIFAAIEEQLGLKLEGSRATVEVFVIDRLERPSEN